MHTMVHQRPGYRKSDTNEQGARRDRFNWMRMAIGDGIRSAFGLRTWQDASRLRMAVIARDGLICGICRGRVHEWDVHIDHIVPVSRGGMSIMSNLRVTHSKCNLRKAVR